MLSGRKWAFRAGFWPDCYAESTEIGPPEGLPESHFGVFPVAVRPKIQPGKPIYGPEAVLCNIECPWDGLWVNLGIVVVGF